MHKTVRSFNVPLALALFGGAVLVGGAILAYPDAKRAPTRTDVGEPAANRVLPSSPEEQPNVASSQAAPATPPIAPRPPLPAPSAQGGGPSAIASAGEAGVLRAPPARSAAEEDEMERPRTRSAPSGEASGTFAPPTTTRRAGPVTSVGATPSAAPETTAAPAGSAGTAPSASASGAPSVGAAPMGSASTAVDPNVPYVVPAFGATGSGGTTSTQPPVANTAGGSTWSGGGGGGGGGTSTGESSTATDAGATAITVPMMLPLNDSASPQTWWPAVSTHLRAGDLVIARVTRDATTSTFMSWSERARADAPTAGYGVAFERIPALDAALTGGVPAALGTLGLSRTDGVTDAALTSIATRVHAAGRKLFVSVDMPSRGPSYATIGARADVVELVASGGTVDATIAAAKDAATKIGAKPVLYVRLPSGLTNATVASAATQLGTALPSAGVALPWSNDLTQVFAGYRP